MYLISSWSVYPVQTALLSFSSSALSSHHLHWAVRLQPTIQIPNPYIISSSGKHLVAIAHPSVCALPPGIYRDTHTHLHDAHATPLKSGSLPLLHLKHGFPTPPCLSTIPSDTIPSYSCHCQALPLPFLSRIPLLTCRLSCTVIYRLYCNATQRIPHSAYYPRQRSHVPSHRALQRIASHRIVWHQHPVSL
jgi:hypothetical protein